MKLPNSKRLSWRLAACASVLVAAAFEIAANFIVLIDGSDHHLQLSWLQGFPNLIRAGIFVPHWLPSAFQNFGSPTFYFYPPFAYYLAAAVGLLTQVQDPTLLYREVAIVTTIVSLGTCYAFLRGQGASKNSAFWGSMLYAFAPFQAYILFKFNAFGSHVSFAILPLILLFVERILRQGRSSLWRDFGLLALTWSLMILTSIPIATLLGYTVLFILILQIRSAPRSRIGLVVLALAFGTLAAGFYLVPIPFLESEIHLSSLFAPISAPPIVYKFLTELPRGKYVSTNTQDVLIWIANVVMLAAFWKARKQKQPREWEVREGLYLPGFGLIIFLLALQYPLVHAAMEQVVPFYKLLQFPLRWNIISCLIFALAWAVIRNPVDQRRFSIVIILWSTIVSINMLAQMSNFKLKHEDSKIVNNSDPPEYIPAWGPKSEETAFYMLHRHENDPFVLTDSLDQVALISLLERAPTHSILNSDFVRPTRVTFHQWYWPQWLLETRSEVLLTSPDSIGRLTAIIPAGAQRIDLKLEETSAEVAGRWVSFAGIFCLIGICSLLWQLGNRSSPKEHK